MGKRKSRGANSNWKNSSEDIWFATMSNKYYFNVDAVKLKRKVLAPYKDAQNKPKDWQESDGEKSRLTYPSNLWTDITVPFWSMPENTFHPTQKPEKLIAKLILASTKPNDLVLDLFSGSGTASVVSKKLERRYIGIEQDQLFGSLALKRLMLADMNKSIQGYENGIFL
ncbi:MAG: site-specific DNA-methyltransferase [Pedobacter agri]